MYKGEVLVTTPQHISGLPLFVSLLDFCDSDDSVIELPEIKELKNSGLLHLKELIAFQQHPGDYPIPTTHLELLTMVRLADYVGADDYLKAAARWLDVGVDSISNINPIRHVYQLIRGRYRASRHNSQKHHHGLCAWCNQFIEEEVVVPCKPSGEPVRMTPCCNLPLHRDCDSGPECQKCHQQMRVLPCVVCNGQIAEGVDFAREFTEALPNRTPCCGADCHSTCRRSDITRCPLCSCPLDNWILDKELLMAGDVLAGRRQQNLNNLRRKNNQTYRDIPVIKPYSFNRY